MNWIWEDEDREAQFERLYNQFGPEWAEEHDGDLFRLHYQGAVKEFTVERLQSYYVAHPSLAEPSRSVLRDAQHLLKINSRAALVLAVAAIELAIKTVLLRPIVFGLIHTEELAYFITELAIHHTGAQRFEDLLKCILASYAGVDLKTFVRTGSTKPLLNELRELQLARNTVVHRGEEALGEHATTAVAVASALLDTIFPQVLAKLDLHIHESGNICNLVHGVKALVYFYPDPRMTPPITGYVTLDVEILNLSELPDAITGNLSGDFETDEFTALRAVNGPLLMWLSGTVFCYEISLARDSSLFSGKLSTFEFTEQTFPAP